jgi:hypothetical protein
MFQRWYSTHLLLYTTICSNNHALEFDPSTPHSDDDFTSTTASAPDQPEEHSAYVPRQLI